MGCIKKLLSLLLSFSFLLLLSGCLATMEPAPTVFDVKVSALLGDKANASKKRYILVPVDKNIKPDNLQYKEYARQIYAILLQKGFQPSDTIKTADCVIYLDYGISSPSQKTETYSSPVIGQTGVSSSYTTGTYSSTTGAFSGTSFNMPTYGVTGYQSHSYSYDIYTRFLGLTAVEIKQGKKPSLGEELWRVEAITTGSSGDLRRVFPAMVTAIKNYIAVDSRKAITVYIDFDNPSMIRYCRHEIAETGYI